MRRGFWLVAFVVLAVASVGSPAQAAGSVDPLNAQVSGAYSGRQNFAFGEAGCSFVHQTFSGDYDASRGPGGSLSIDSCVSFGSGSLFDVRGTFTLTTSSGAVLSGTVEGSTDGGVPASLDLVLTVTSGTRQFRAVSGTIVLSGSFTNDVGVLGRGPVNATLVGHLVRQRVAA